MKILVTAGGTSEPIDGVRRLTNTSTGATGAALAHHFSACGADVLLLHAERASIGDAAPRRETFVSFADLEEALRRHLGGEPWDAVVHLAAVSDYSVDTIEVDGTNFTPGEQHKIGAGNDVTIRLKPNPKLIDGLKGCSLNPHLRVVGFKLTVDTDREEREQAVSKLIGRGCADLVIQNDLREIDEDRHEASFWDQTGLIAQTHTKRNMAETLWKWLIEGEDHEIMS